MLSDDEFDANDLMSVVPETEPQFWPQPPSQPISDPPSEVDDDETQPPSQLISDLPVPELFVSDSPPAEVVVSDPSFAEVPATDVMKRYKNLAPDTYDGYEGVDLSEFEEEEVQSAPPPKERKKWRINEILQVYLGDLYNPDEYKLKFVFVSMKA